jgi:sugar O-acyltransferase (sialic acid O-acetyltransferase NeuD family)
VNATSAELNREQLCLAGSGSFAVEVGEWAQDAGWEVVGLIELLDLTRVGTSIGGRAVLAPDSQTSQRSVVVAAGGPRRTHWERLEGHAWQPRTIVHPRAWVSRSAVIGAGCVIGPGAVIGAETVVGEHTLISRGVLVGHHVQIGAFVSLLPGVNLASHTSVGDQAAVGMGAVIVDHTRIGIDATVAAGAVVLREVADGTRVQGIPAREYRS